MERNSAVNNETVIGCGERSLHLAGKIAIAAKLKRSCQVILSKMRLVSAILRHPGSPWYAKAIAGCAFAYIFSPVQIIPNFIPVIGQLDDVLVLYGSLKLLQKLTPPGVLASCQVQAPRGQNSQPSRLARLSAHSSNAVG